MSARFPGGRSWIGVGVYTMSVATSHSGETADIETSSEGYAARFRGAVGEWLLGVQERAVMKALARCEVQSVLDVGGGHGQTAGSLSRRGYAVKVAGSDQSCAARLSPLIASGKCTFVSGDLLNLPFPNENFDAVVSLRFISHCDQWQRLVSELTRLARKVVVIDYPVRRKGTLLELILFPIKKFAEGNTRRYRLYDNEELAAEFRKCGFELQERVRQFALPMVVHRLLRSPTISRFIEGGLRRLGVTDAIGSPIIASFVRR